MDPGRRGAPRRPSGPRPARTGPGRGSPGEVLGRRAARAREVPEPRGQHDGEPARVPGGAPGPRGAGGGPAAGGAAVRARGRAVLPVRGPAPRGVAGRLPDGRRVSPLEGGVPDHDGDPARRRRGLGCVLQIAEEASAVLSAPPCRPQGDRGCVDVRGYRLHLGAAVCHCGGFYWP